MFKKYFDKSPDTRIVNVMITIRYDNNYNAMTMRIKKYSQYLAITKAQQKTNA